jgi:hypothetical protein
MSDLYRQAMLQHAIGIHNAAIARLNMMIAVNQARFARGAPEAYNANQLKEAYIAVQHSVVDPENFA